MRRDCVPYLIDEAHKHTALTRIHFADKNIAEVFLQETIDTSPCFLPVDRLDSDFYPLVSLGREIANIDNLLISPTGKLTIVETKLWRNPQATREVIAQIIEYANRLWKMEYDEFQELARSALTPAPLKNKSLYELVRDTYPTEVLGEADFHDEVQKCLDHAEFMLLIVGDGIRENIEGMTEMLYQPQMHFKFGLVEIQIYESPELPHKLLVPNLVAHATELRRTVVKVEGGGKTTVSVNIDDPAPTFKSRRVLTEEEFFAELDDSAARPLFKQLIDFGKELGAVPLWRASSVGMRLPDPQGIRKLGYTLYLLNLNATISDTFLGWQINEVFDDSSIADVRAKELSKMFGIPFLPRDHSLERGIPWKQVAGKLDEFKSLMRDTVTKLGKKSK